MTMPTSTIPSAAGRRIRVIGGIGLLSLSMLAGTAGIAQAASVTPIPISSGNPDCGDFAEEFGGTWTEFKLEGAALSNGTHTDGTLSVTISNFENSSGGTPGSFDWSSNIGVDAVFVKAGSDKHHLYVYDPESTGDTDLGPQAGSGNGISHISFCYDVGDDPTPTPEITPSPTPEPTPTPTGSEEPAESEGPSPTGEVGGVVGTPQPTPPATDMASPDGGDRSAFPATLVVAGLLAAVAILAALQPRRSRA